MTTPSATTETQDQVRQLQELAGQYAASRTKDMLLASSAKLVAYDELYAAAAQLHSSMLHAKSCPSAQDQDDCNCGLNRVLRALAAAPAPGERMK